MRRARAANTISEKSVTFSMLPKYSLITLRSILAIVVALVPCCSGAFAWQLPYTTRSAVNSPGSPAAPAVRSGGAHVTVKSRTLRTLPSGTDILAPEERLGLGRLTIENSTSHDAVAKIVDGSVPGRVVRFVYVRAKEKTTVATIPPGNYRVLFATGDDWSADANRFTFVDRVLKWRGVLEFEEARYGNNLEFVHYTLKVPAGPTPELEQISESEFHSSTGR